MVGHSNDFLGRDGAGIVAFTGMSKLGCTLMTATDRGVCGISFAASPEDAMATILLEWPGAAPGHGMEQQARWWSALIEQIENPKSPFTLPLDIAGTDFQREVWAALQTIPMGQTRTDWQLAQQLKRPKAVRAVANACAANPVAIVVPCHRVIGSDGQMRGYRWGVERKQQLLEMEAKHPTRGGSLCG
jgi:AraC family transcriptional regulator of adaptative response/methylated-DNA-[protein]-cysteine methyltransferase